MFSAEQSATALEEHSGRTLSSIVFKSVNFMKRSFFRFVLLMLSQTVRRNDTSLLHRLNYQRWSTNASELG